MKRILLTAAIGVLLAACGGNASKKTTATDKAEKIAAKPDMHTAQTSLDYIGTYTGTIPAADCPGIDMTLRLKDDGTYTLHTKYIDRDAKFDEKGAYTVAGNLLTLNPSDGNGEMQYFKIEENRLRMLGADQQPVTGALADNYLLTKQN